MNDSADSLEGIQGEEQVELETLCTLNIAPEFEAEFGDVIRDWATQHPRVTDLKINAGNSVRIELKTEGGRNPEKTFTLDEFKKDSKGCLEKTFKRNVIEGLSKMFGDSLTKQIEEK